MPTIEATDTQNIVAVPRIDWMLLTQQRAALVQALAEVQTDEVFQAVEGVLCLLDTMSNLAEEGGLLSPVDRESWWNAGCEAVGMHVELFPDCEHEKLTLHERQPVCRKCNRPVA